MGDQYMRNILKRNWKSLVIGILILIIISFIVKNISEIPYEDQHLMTETLPLSFDYQGVNVNGFFYVAYWVRTDPEEVSSLSSQEIASYLFAQGRLNLNPIKDKIISVLKTYPLEEIQESWYDDYQYFKKRNIYFIKNDKKLEKLLKKENLPLELPFKFKKAFFVYLDENTFQEFLEEDYKQ